MHNWGRVRVGLSSIELEKLREAVVAAGKVQKGELPEDIADAILRLFGHTDPEVRAEAVRTIGVHWRLSRAVRAIAKMADPDEDSSVQLYAIGGLCAIGAEHEDLRCFASTVIAGVILNNCFGDFERMIAYLKLLLVEGKISFDEYVRRDRDVPESLNAFDWDRSWVEGIAHQDCP